MTAGLLDLVSAAGRPPPAPPAAVPRFARLGLPYAQPAPTTPLPAPRRLWGNDALAAELGLCGAADAPAGWWPSEAATAVLAGNRPWPGYAALATVYAGHQFGRYTASLGDGRAHLIAELDTPTGPRALQLKGAGPTPYARGGDGRTVLRSALRELLGSEAMHALGIPSTRALSLVASPLRVQRDAGETTAVLCRVAPSFLRFGHFEYFARHPDAARPGRLAALADWVIAQHFPQHLGHADRHARWLAEVAQRSATLVAMWQTVGFCHGVMNTDNCAILGLTLDYGPFGFMDRFRAHHVCNHSDHDGRYAYTAQPAVSRWNLAQLLRACATLPGCEAAQAEALLQAHDETYRRVVMRRWAAKLGLGEVQDGDAALLNRWLTLLQRSRCDFTDSFRALSDLPHQALRQRFAEPPAFDAWAADWQARLARQGEPAGAVQARQRAANPRYVLRNHLAQAAIAAAEAGDPGELHRLAALLRRPFDEQPGAAAYAAPPPADAAGIDVSCAS